MGINSALDQNARSVMGAVGQSVGLKPRRASTNPHKLKDQFAQLAARKVMRKDALSALRHVNCGFGFLNGELLRRSNKVRPVPMRRSTS